MLTFYIVRHGETEENAAGILQGHLPGILSEKGKKQVRQLRKQLMSLDSPQVIWASDLKRTLDTATILNRPFQLEIHTSTLLRERDWGELTGKSISNLPSIFPESVESVAQLMDRARNFLNLMQRTYGEQSLRLLIVTHGLLSRALQAVLLNKEMCEIPRMQNGEIRILEQSAPTDNNTLHSDHSSPRSSDAKNEEIKPITSES